MKTLILSCFLSVLSLGTAATWEKLSGWNACTKACGCVGNCHDVPGFKYKGKQDNADACEKICSSDPSNCDIWIYSSGSKNCWWRTDHQWVVTEQSDVTSGCQSSVAQCAVAPGPSPAPPTPPP